MDCIQASAGAEPAVTIAMVPVVASASAGIPRSLNSGRVVGRGRHLKTTKRKRRSCRKSSPKSPMKVRTKEKKVTRAKLKLKGPLARGLLLGPRGDQMGLRRTCVASRDALSTYKPAATECARRTPTLLRCTASTLFLPRAWKSVPRQSLIIMLAVHARRKQMKRRRKEVRRRVLARSGRRDLSKTWKSHQRQRVNLLQRGRNRKNLPSHCHQRDNLRRNSVFPNTTTLAIGAHVLSAAVDLVFRSHANTGCVAHIIVNSWKTRQRAHKKNMPTMQH